MQPYMTFINQRVNYPFANLFNINGNKALARRLNTRFQKAKHAGGNASGDKFELQASAPWYSGRLYVMPKPAPKGSPTLSADSQTYSPVIRLFRRLRDAFPFQRDGRVRLWQMTETHPWGQYIA
jgi:hypothetical protein